MAGNQPREYDAVLGGGNQAPVDGVVLGGIEGVRRSLSNPEAQVIIAGLYQALNYGDTGLDLVIQSLQDDKQEVRRAAYSILRGRRETRVIQKLEKYSKYQIFDCISTLEEHESRINSVCITPDGVNVISGGEDSVIIWEWRQKQFKKNFITDKYFCSDDSVNEEINFVCINQLRETIFVRCRSGIITELSWRNPYSQNVLTNSGNGLHHSLDINDKGNIIFLGDGSGKIASWNWQNNQTKRVIGKHTKPIFSLVTNGKFLFSGSGDGTIKIWNWQAQEKLIRTLTGHSFWIKALCLSPDGKTLFSGSGDNTIKIWDWQKGEIINTLKGHSLGVNSLAISPDGNTLISASDDATIKVWNWETGQLQATLTGHSAEVSSIVLSPDGKYLFSGSHDKTVKVWGLE